MQAFCKQLEDKLVHAEEEAGTSTAGLGVFDTHDAQSTFQFPYYILSESLWVDLDLVSQIFAGPWCLTMMTRCGEESFVQDKIGLGPW